MRKLPEFPTPWRVHYTTCQRRTGGGRYAHILADDGSYVAERVTSEILARQIVDAVNERDELRAQLAAVTARAEAAEARLTRVGEYATYYVLAWELFDESEVEPEPLDFGEWLAEQGEVQP